MTLLVSLHDVSPAHQARLERAEELLARVGVSAVTYLFVPDFHGQWPARESPRFVSWVHAGRPFRVGWALHGYSHRADPARSWNLANLAKQRLLTAREGEFLALSPAETRRRVAAGIAVCEAVLGTRPDGFVPPAWLANASLPHVLCEHGISFTEDHRRIYDVARHRALASPVITWATRTWLRRYGSLAVCPALARMWANTGVLRVALHPYDFAHAKTVRSIERILAAALRRRACSLYTPDLFETAAA